MNTQTARLTTAFRRAAFAAVVAFAPAMVMAQTPSAKAPEVVAAKVSFSDLDLATPAGQLAAKDRVSAAAHDLCVRFSDTRKVDDRANIADCYRETMDSSLRQLSAKVALATSAGTQLAQNRQ